MKKLLLGDEAIAQGAIDAGLSGVYAYPGTPSTEITEYIQESPIAKERNIECEVSLENLMACGLGACLCCVEDTVDGHVCVCKEGPVFNTRRLKW